MLDPAPDFRFPESEALHRRGIREVGRRSHRRGARPTAAIYFTSGSPVTEGRDVRAGLPNHLFAKIDDLKIGEGTVVAQTAPQC
jgi:hypothetical protein